jgi:hypothetical protein
VIALHTLTGTLHILKLAREHAIETDERLAHAGQRSPGLMFVSMPVDLLDAIILGLETAQQERQAAARQRVRWRRGQRVAWAAAALVFVVLAVW